MHQASIGNCQPKPANLCRFGDSLRLRINDKKLRAKMERLMTSDARKALNKALSDVAGHPVLQDMFVQTAQTNRRASNATSNSTTTAEPVNVATMDPEPVMDEPDPHGQW